MKPNRPKRIGPLCLFSWGWDLSLPFVFDALLGVCFLTYSRVEGEARLYVSRDGTPVADETNTVRTLFRRTLTRA